MTVTTTRRHEPASRAHRPARWGLVVLELLVGALAVFGGVGLLRDGMGMPMEWLDGTPFDSWALPGVFLLLVVAVPMLGAAGLELARSRWAYAASVAAGLLQVGWIVVQVAVLRRFFFLQPVMAAVGLAVIALAWAAHRRSPLRPSGGQPE